MYTRTLKAAKCKQKRNNVFRVNVKVKELLCLNSTDTSGVQEKPINGPIKRLLVKGA